jgi:HEAT repeat protein
MTERERTTDDYENTLRSLQQLLSSDDDIVLEARRRLAALGDRATEPLIRILQGAATEAPYFLGDSGRRQAQLVRWKAALELGRLKPPRALEPLIDALKDKERYVRHGALDALGNIADARAVRPIAEALTREPPDRVNDPYRPWCDALVRLGEPSVDALCELLSHDNPAIRRNAALSLDTIKKTHAGRKR